MRYLSVYCQWDTCQYIANEVPASILPMRYLSVYCQWGTCQYTPNEIPVSILPMRYLSVYCQWGTCQYIANEVPVSILPFWYCGKGKGDLLARSYKLMARDKQDKQKQNCVWIVIAEGFGGWQFCLSVRMDVCMYIFFIDINSMPHYTVTILILTSCPITQ